MRVLEIEADGTVELSLTSLRRKWCARDCVISDFLSFLVECQGKIFLTFFK